MRSVVHGAFKDEARSRRRRILAIAAGLFIGVAASQILPAAATLLRALEDAGIGRAAAEVAVALAFGVGGIEGSLLAWPLASKMIARTKGR